MSWGISMRLLGKSSREAVAGTISASLQEGAERWLPIGNLPVTLAYETHTGVGSARHRQSGLDSEATCSYKAVLLKV